MNYFTMGLGNTGDRYQYTRHNVGWIILQDLLALDWEYNKYLNADVLVEHINDQDEVLYLLPQTMMNNSGKSAKALSDFYPEFRPETLIVIYDDLDLPLGTVRISFDRGSAGHNGIRSIEQDLKTQAFIRIRVGISKNINGRLVKPPVLGNFEAQELALVRGPVSRLVDDILHHIYKKGYQSAMNHYNCKQSESI